MSSKNIIAVVGVTGIQGSSVAKTFLRHPDWHVRGLTRNPSSAAALALAAQGVELVQADLDDTPSLLAAFKGSHAVFVNTDFFGHLFAAIADPFLLKSHGNDYKSANEYAFAREVAQNLSAAAAASDPSVLATLRRFVVSSLGDARALSGGRYATLWHFDSKAEVGRLIRERYPALTERMSLLDVGHYASNWRAFPMMAPQKQADGSFVVLRPVSPELQMPFVDAERDVGSFVWAMVVELGPGKEVLGVGEMMTWPAWTALWGEVLGVEAVYREVSDDDFFAGVPEELKRELADTYDYAEEFGYTGGDPKVLMPGQLGVHVPVTSMAEYIKREDWSSVLDS